MNTIARKPRQAGCALRLRSLDGKGTQTFSALREAGSGAAAVCCEAEGACTHRGLLKEYWPADIPMERDENGVLRAAPGHEEAFSHGRAAFLAQYRNMQRLAAEHPEMYSFLPVLELFEDDVADGGTVYVWDPHPPQIAFSQICEETRASCLASPERQVYRNLNAVRSLVQCLQHLHSVGYAHGDIKPDNFGFSERAGELLTQAVCLFDLDTVRPLADPACRARGTRGYTDPAASADGAAADLYAAGCVLFRALVILPESEDGLYTPDMFPYLQALTESSVLLAGIPGDAGALLRAKIAQILRRCLCPPASRYVCSEDLLADIDRALYYAEPLVRGVQARSETHSWQLQKTGTMQTLPEESRTGVALAYWLFRHPLVPAVQEDGTRKLRVLLCGLDHNAQIYLDTVLQLAQIAADDITVQIAGASPDEMREYLRVRPALQSFFEVQGRRPDMARYGSIQFADPGLRMDAPQTWPEELRTFAAQADAVHVCLGSDTRSVKTARAIADMSPSDAKHGRISFLRRTPGGRPLSGPIAAVDMEDICLDDTQFADLERMAFNVQLVWETSLQTDFEAIEERFHEPHNYCASLMGAVAAQYRALADSDESRASDPVDAGAVRTRRMWQEHKRWVTEKICAGWTPAEDLRVCAAGGGKAKLAHLRQHACIVPSRPDNLLRDLVQERGAAFWDTAAPEDIAELDPLDAMSLRMHQLLRRRAGDLPDAKMVAGRLMTLLEEISARDGAAHSAFLAWRQALEAAQTGALYTEETCSKRMSAFLAAADRLPREDARRARRLAEELQTELAPVLAGMRRLDYKETDGRMVDATPFILTYSTNSALLAPFRTGSNEARLENVRCAAAMNPAQLLYVYVLEDPANVPELVHCMEGVQSFLGGCSMRAKVQMHILSMPEVSDEAVRRLQQMSAHIWPVAVRKVSGQEEICAAVRAIAEEASAEQDITAVQQADTQLGRLLLRSCPKLPVCSVAESGRVQLSGQNTDALPAVFPGPGHVDISDLLALRGAPATKETLPDFGYICDILWNEYTRNPDAWRSLCIALREAAAEADLVGTLQLDVTGPGENRTFYLPAYCRKSAERAAAALLEHGAVGGVQCRKMPYGDIVQLTLEDCRAEEGACDKLFGEIVCTLAAPVQIFVEDGVLQVMTDGLKVPGLRLEDGWNGDAAVLLSRLEQHGIVQGLRVRGSKAEFRYTSPACKRLLTDPALILELRTAAQLQEMTELDDLLCRADMQLPQDGLYAERVFTAVRGYRCVFLRCAQPGEAAPEMIQSLAALRDTAGVGAAAMIVSDRAWQADDEVLQLVEASGVLLVDTDDVPAAVRQWLETPDVEMH